MAEAATKMLGIRSCPALFLWDRPNHTLVGRPAAGVEGNELRIPDDQGVVGEVIQSREPRLVNAGAGAERSPPLIRNSATNQSLVCVPLLSGSGKCSAR